MGLNYFPMLLCHVVIKSFPAIAIFFHLRHFTEAELTSAAVMCHTSPIKCHVKMKPAEEENKLAKTFPM